MKVNLFVMLFDEEAATKFENFIIILSQSPVAIKKIKSRENYHNMGNYFTNGTLS